MEKASTPRNRLTRSAAKQVNTPPVKIGQEESLEQKENSIEELKHNVRKSRRKINVKPKTNGDSSANTDNKKIKNSSDISDGNSLDGCESDDSNISEKQRSSPKPNNHQTSSPTISRKSLRARRSITPGPEIESSASKKMKRSTSEGKLETLSTPTSRRNIRAKSESKDFVFTPSKTKSFEVEKLNTLSDSKYIHRNSALRVIDKIVEANEGEESSQDEESEKQTLKSQETNSTVVKTEENKDTMIKSNSVVNEASLTDSGHAETNSIETPVEEVKAQENMLKEKEGLQEVSSPPLETENTLDLCVTSEKLTHQATEQCDNITLSCGNSALVEKNQNMSLDEKSESLENVLEDKTVHVNCAPNESSQNIMKNDELSNPNKETLVTLPENESIDIDPVNDGKLEVVSNELLSNTDKCETNIDNDDYSSLKVSDNSSATVQPENINNNVRPVEENLEAEEEKSGTPETKLVTSIASEEINSNEKCITIFLSSTSKEQQLNNNESVTISGTDNDGLGKSEIIDQTATISVADDDNLGKNEMIDSVVISESDSPEPIDDIEMCEDKVKKADFVNTCQEKSNIINEESDFNTENYNVKNYTVKDGNLVVIPESEELSEKPEKTELKDSNSCSDNEITEKQPSHLNPPIESYNISVEDPLEMDDSEIIQLNSPVNSETNAQDPFGDEQSETTALIKETNKTQILNEFGEEEFVEVRDSVTLKLNEDKSPIGNSALIEDDKQNEPQSEEIYDEENYNDENYDEDNFDEDKIEEDSCDIYKNMSDLGIDEEEKLDEDQFDHLDDDSVSSDIRSGTGDSDSRNVSSYDGEEEEENIEEKLSSDKPKITADDQNRNQAGTSKDGEKLYDTNSPMTYDRALAILNKNRVKKIDDEEFFDMFTQELNRVSEESGSDSDIAIVDEYIVEPDEPAKKPNQKSGNTQTNQKPDQRSLHPPISNQPITSAQHFTAVYNQQIHSQQNHPGIPQHNHPNMSRMNYSQGGMYHQYNQNIPVNAIRGPVMYNQFPPPSTSMPDPRMFNSHVPPDVNFSRAGMFNHPIASVSDTALHSGTPGLKIRNINEMNCSQPPNIKNSNFATSEQVSTEQFRTTAMLGINTPRDPSKQQESTAKNIGISASTMTEAVDNSDRMKSQSSGTRETGKSSTPILDLLGLDKRKLELLKEVLGLTKCKKTKKNRLERREKHTKKQYDDENVECEKAMKKILIKQILDSNPAFIQTRYDRSSTELSTEETASSSGSRGIIRNKKPHSDSSTDGTFESENREVNMENGNFIISITSRQNKQRHRSKKVSKRTRSNSYSYKVIPNPETSKPRKKRKRTKKLFENDSSSESLDLEPSSKRKMTKVKQSKKQPTMLKSNCGTFIVDPLTASSQSSESEVHSQEEQEAAEMNYLKYKRMMKREINSGKNKLSNMFTQHSFKTPRPLKRKADETFTEDSDKLRKKRAKELKKLPAEILEKLAEEGKKKQSKLSDAGPSKKQDKLRKKSKKVKVKRVAAEQNYIPCVTAGATQFSLSRLDKDGTLAAAEKAAKFRSDNLYGSAVKRITILDFKG